MFQAILSMSNLNCWTSKLNFKQRVTLHWVLQASALVSTTIGFFVIVVNKFKADKDHFQTTHAIFGLSTYLLTIIVASGGVWTKYSFQLRKYFKPVYAKISHALMGIIVFCLGVVTVSLAVYSEWFMKVSTGDMQLPLVAALGLSAAYVIYNPMVLCYKRITNAMRSSL